MLAVREAADAGTTPRRLRGPTGQRHLHGRYSSPPGAWDPALLHEALLRAATVSGQDVTSHRSAALLWATGGHKVTSTGRIGPLRVIF